jgi:hypothetical protein
MSREAPSHQESGLVKRFLLGETDREENRVAVRHLLRSCEPCRRAARRIWEELETMTITGMVAWGLRPIIKDLEQIQGRLEELVESLPAAEVTPSEAEDVALRDVLACMLTDRLKPALRDLRSLTGEEA